MGKEILIYGAGGHARVIVDLVERQGLFSIAGMVDDVSPEPRRELMGYRVYRDPAELYRLGVRSGIVAVGDNWLRSRVAERIAAACPGFSFVSAVHPGACLGRGVELGPGTVVMAGACINSGSALGAHCIVNTRASVDHDAVIGDFASIAPGAVLGGGVRVGEYCAVGMGATLIQRVAVGAGTLIGAGSLVLKEIEPMCVAYGSPCKKIRERELATPYL